MALFTTVSGNDEEAFPLWTPEPDIDKLLAYEDINAAIIELDNYISQLCGWGEEMEKLTEPQRKFYYNQNLEREVNNGGFHLYFINSAGNYAHETLDALKAFGANKTAAILQSAMDQFPNEHVPADRSDRERW